MNLIQKVKTVGRDKFYYDQYQYCVNFNFQDLPALRHSDHIGIDRYIENTNWRRKINFGGSWRYHTFRHPITKESTKNCHKLLDAKKAIPSEHKLIISLDIGHLYTNSLMDVHSFVSSPGVVLLNIRKVEIDRRPDTMIIKSAKHDQRTYFKNQQLTVEQKQQLISFLKYRTDIRCSPSLYEWMTKFEKYTYICNNYFIDHNDDGFLTMLALVSPVKIKKTYTLLTE